MTSRISHNIQAQSPNFDKAKLLAHLTRLRPSWIIVLDGLQVCRDIKATVPECNVVHRAYAGENNWDKISPGTWVANKKNEIGDADVWCYATNEAGFSDELLNWFTAVIELAAAVHLKVLVGNFSVGTPEAADWNKPAAVAFLKALDKHRSTAVLGLHEYFIGVPTSGFLGGWPNNAGVAPKPENAGKGVNLIPAENWPRPEAAAKMTTFHCGRFKFMLDACAKQKIKPPRVILSEHGADDVSDLKVWAETLPKTSPYQTIRGWKSCVNAWAKFYPQWANPQRAYFEMLKYLDWAVYQGTPVEAQCVFSWGYTSEPWIQFSVMDAPDLQLLLEQYATVPQQPPQQPPPTEPPPQNPPGLFLTDAQVAYALKQIDAIESAQAAIDNAANNLKVLLQDARRKTQEVQQIAS